MPFVSTKTLMFLQLASTGVRQLLRNNFRSASLTMHQIGRHKSSFVHSSVPACSFRRRFTSSSVPTAAAQGVPDIVLRTATIAKVESILGHSFQNRAVLAQAMTHRSIVNTGKENVPIAFEDKDGQLVNVSKNNERLELVGDKVFGLLVAQTLYDRAGEFTEGKMSIMSQSLVSRKKATSYCRKLGLDKFLMESDRIRGVGKGSRYGDFFEAILGALFIDGGYAAAENFFRTKVVPTWTEDESHGYDYCYKQALQEYLVSQGLPVTALGAQLKYVQVRSDFRRQLFTQGIELFGRRVSMATGRTRVSADQDAAKRLLGNLRNSKTTCFLIRLARRANDQASLAKLQVTRAAQVEASKNEIGCNQAAMQAEQPK